MAKFRILSIDGGALRGIIPARILQHIGLTTNDFDCFAGTSSGSITCVAFACGYTPKQIVDMYLNEGKNIFKRKDPILSTIGIRSKYDINNLENVLKKYYKELTIGTIKSMKKDLIVPTFQLNSIDRDSNSKSAMPKIYSSWNKDDLNEKLYSVVCKSAAAPTYFQSYKGYVDGAISGCNNPSLEAVCSAIDAGYSLQDIEVTSIGTGISDNSFDAGDIGLIQWAPKIIDYMLNGSEEISEFGTKSLIKNNFKRIQLRINNYKFDDVNKLDEMIKEVDRYFGKEL